MGGISDVLQTVTMGLGIGSLLAYLMEKYKWSIQKGAVYLIPLMVLFNIFLPRLDAQIGFEQEKPISTGVGLAMFIVFTWLRRKHDLENDPSNTE